MKHYIFADESNLNSKYLLIGGIWVDEPTYKAVVQKCNDFKISVGWTIDAKFNWKNVSKLTVPHYKKFIDILFEFNLKFNAIVIDQEEFKLKHNEEKDEELGFYKFYYLLLWHNSSNENKLEYQIYLDRRNNKKETRLDDLKTILKHGKIQKINGETYSFQGLNIASLEPVNSKHYNLIQFSDILLGAIGYHYNMQHLRRDASPHKIELAEHIAHRIGVKNLKFSTFKKGLKNINIWKFQANKVKSAL